MTEQIKLLTYSIVNAMMTRGTFLVSLFCTCDLESLIFLLVNEVFSSLNRCHVICLHQNSSRNVFWQSSYVLVLECTNNKMVTRLKPGTF